MTGISGAAGSWLAAEALRHGARLLAMVRGADAPAARNRVVRALHSAGVDDPERVGLVAGDLCRPELGGAALDPQLRGVRRIIHCAARVEFTETSDGLLRRSNVEGTLQILDLAERLQAELVYVSTAYVAGTHPGVSYEDPLPKPPDFNNDYERSKHEAEGLVREWADRTGLPVIILRPSILVGDSVRGAAARFNTIYDFMRAFERLIPALGDREIRSEGQAGVTKNLMPLDTFSRSAWRIIERGRPGCYHLTHPAPPRLSDLRDVFSRMFGIARIRIVDAADFERQPPSTPERLFQRAVAIYQPYMRQEPIFDRANTDAALAGSGIALPAMDDAYYARLLAFARAADWIAPGECRDDEKISCPPPANPCGVERYFREFLAEKIGRQLLPELRKVTAILSINVEDAINGGRPWVLEIRDGALVSISRNGLKPQCAYTLNTAAFGEIVSGRLEPQRAFFERRVELDGDMEVGLRLAFILAAFFKQYGYEMNGD